MAKASLYNTFGSKDELVRAYLEGRHARPPPGSPATSSSTTIPGSGCSACSRRRASCSPSPGFRGCAFVSASAESPGEAVTRAADEYRGWMRGLFTGLAREAGVPDPEALGRQLHMIYDGASLSARMDHDRSARRHPGGRRTLLDAALATGG